MTLPQRLKLKVPAAWSALELEDSSFHWDTSPQWPEIISPEAGTPIPVWIHTTGGPSLCINPGQNYGSPEGIYVDTIQITSSTDPC